MKMSSDSPSISNNDLVTGSIKVMQEFASITKEVVETGKVRVIKTVSEETVGINVPIV